MCKMNQCCRVKWLWLRGVLIAITFFFFFISISNIVQSDFDDGWPVYGYDNVHSGYYPLIGKTNLTGYIATCITLSKGYWVYPQPTIKDIRGDSDKEIITSCDPSSVYHRFSRAFYVS